MEQLNLIRVRKKPMSKTSDWAAKYRGAMKKQSRKELDNQLTELRNSWE